MTQYITISSHSYGGKTWIARITGTDPKFGLARVFESKRDVTSSKSNKYRDLEWVLVLDEGAVYEYREMDNSSGGGDSGYWQVRDGKLVDVSRQDILEHFAMKATHS